MIRRVCYFTTSFPGKRAAQIQVARMCDAFGAAGADVVLLRSGMRDADAGATREIQRFYGLRRPLALHTLPGVPALKNYDPILRTSLLRYVRSACNGGSSEMMLYGRSPAILPMSRILELRRSGGWRHWPAVACEIHEQLEPMALQRLKHVDAVITITEALQRRLVEQGVDPAKILVAADGADLELYDRLVHEPKEALRRRLGLPLDKKLVVFTGHLYEDRGLDMLVEAARFLRADSQVVIVGGTAEDIRRVRDHIASARVAERVTLTGHLDPAHVPAYQVAADVLVIPYGTRWRIQKWSSPVKLFEYMASGAPIVSTDFPSLREVLNEANAELVPPDQPEALAAGITRVLGDPPRAHALAARALADVRRYTWEARAQAILQFVRDRWLSANAVA